LNDPFDQFAAFRAQFEEYNRAVEMGGGWYGDLLKALADQQTAVAGSFRGSIQEALNFSMEGALPNPVFTELFVGLQQQVIEQWQEGFRTFQAQQGKVAGEVIAALTRNINYRW